MAHYSDEFNKLDKEHTLFTKRRLLGIIERASDEDIKFLFKVANNLKGYIQFEMLVKNLFGKN